MLLPQVWLRRLWLRHALRNYPIYDPPHKIEERLLSREQAAENFDYFMGVRQQRAAYFCDWLRRYFGVVVTRDEEAVKELNRWGNRYAGLLLVKGSTGHPIPSYHTYDPPWTGDFTGHNALFDMGTVLGEILIAKCPNLHWDINPISAVLPRTADILRRGQGMGFQRPSLTGFDDVVADANPLHTVYVFARQMMESMTTWEGIIAYCRRPSFIRKNVREELLNMFKTVLRYYPSGVMQKLRKRMSSENYLAFIDELDSKGEEDVNE